jgi:hypothetical protein
MNSCGTNVSFFSLMMKGGRTQARSDGKRKFFASTWEIPALKYTKVLPEFQLLSKKETVTQDALMNTLLVPVPYVCDNLIN